jgi:hypothetical protein
MRPFAVNGPRSMAIYYPPAGMVDHILNTYPVKLRNSLKPLLKTYSGHLFASAVMSYVFRLKPDILQQFSKKYSSRYNADEPVWGLHVRHGDVKSFHHFIRQKRIFSFESYFTVARDLSHMLNATPARIFVSTDSVRANEIPDLFDNFNIVEDDIEEREVSAGSDDDDDDDDTYYNGEEETELSDDEEELQPQHNRWFGNKVPQIFTVNNTDRYRTEHGFVVAAAENCVDAVKKKGRKHCHVPHQFPVDVQDEVYDGQQKILGSNRAVRLMRMLLEAVEDLYLLSLSDVIIAQGSSHFSTAAILLMWGRNGAQNIDLTTQFLDIDTMITGDSASAFLQGTNLWNSSYVGPGDERWRIHTYRFITGLPSTEMMGTVPVSLPYDPWSPHLRMKMVHYLPQVSADIFYRESKTWLGLSTEPAFPGRCIDTVQEFDESLITNLVNIGADHFQYMHAKEAQRCWMASLQAASKWKGRSSMMDVVLEVSAGNIASIVYEGREYALLGQQRGADPSSINRINVFGQGQQPDNMESIDIAPASKATRPTASKTQAPVVTPIKRPTTTPKSQDGKKQQEQRMQVDDDHDDYYDEDVAPEPPPTPLKKESVKNATPKSASTTVPTKDSKKTASPATEPATSQKGKVRAEDEKTVTSSIKPDENIKKLNKIIKKIEKLELEIQLLKLEMGEYKDSLLE